MTNLVQFFPDILDLEKRLQYVFKDKELLARAFIHRSFVNEQKELTDEHNERLEFLGDAVLSLLVSDYLYRLYPSVPEGELSNMRSHLVQAGSCADYLERLGVSDHLKLGRGEQLSGQRGRDSIYADLFEAIVGAIFLDSGFEAAREFVFEHFLVTIGEALRSPARNFKAELQDYSQRTHQETPDYRVVEEQGPDHEKQFVIEVSIDGKVMGSGSGASKKEAQQNAAEEALKGIQR
jgi:ribonuclease III